jgi:hypothetical protein
MPDLERVETIPPLLKRRPADNNLQPARRATGACPPAALAPAGPADDAERARNDVKTSASTSARNPFSITRSGSAEIRGPRASDAGVRRPLRAVEPPRTKSPGVGAPCGLAAVPLPSRRGLPNRAGTRPPGTTRNPASCSPARADRPCRGVPRPRPASCRAPAPRCPPEQMLANSEGAVNLRCDAHVRPRTDRHCGDRARKRSRTRRVPGGTADNSPRQWPEVPPRVGAETPVAGPAGCRREGRHASEHLRALRDIHRRFHKAASGWTRSPCRRADAATGLLEGELCTLSRQLSRLWTRGSARSRGLLTGHGPGLRAWNEQPPVQASPRTEGACRNRVRRRFNNRPPLNTPPRRARSSGPRPASTRGLWGGSLPLKSSDGGSARLNAARRQTATPLSAAARTDRAARGWSGRRPPRAYSTSAVQPGASGLPLAGKVAVVAERRGAGRGIAPPWARRGRRSGARSAASRVPVDEGPPGDLDETAERGDCARRQGFAAGSITRCRRRSAQTRSGGRWSLVNDSGAATT